MRWALLATCMAVTVAIAPARAQMPPAAGEMPKPTGAGVKDSSLSHSALKATTYKVGTTIANLGMLSFAAGDFLGGTALTIANTGFSWLAYTGNDYLWDTYLPSPAKTTADQAFDASGDVWRTTGKFLTYKPPVFLFKLASIYVYTGSATTALLFGPASSLTNTAVFYINNVAWDVYDWYAATPKLSVAARP